MAGWVLHVDLDQFIAAVELLRHPELRGRPVVVGGDGDPTKRGVVSTASYEARAFGVGSGMPLRTAFKRCPQAAFLPVDAETYLAASRRVMDTLRTFPGTVEVAGWDEAFLAVEHDDPEALAGAVRDRVHEVTELWCSIGVGDNKLRAKIASGLAKPAGVFRLTADTWTEVMGGLSVDALWGIGRKTAAKLETMGVRTVEQLAAADADGLSARFGPRTGPWLQQLAQGEDRAIVTDAPRVARGRGREHTYQRDLVDPDQIRSEVERLATELVDDLREEGRPAIRVVVKVRFAPFTTRTRGVALDRPSMDPSALRAGAAAALERFELDRPVRLLGVRAEMARPAEG